MIDNYQKVLKIVTSVFEIIQRKLGVKSKNQISFGVLKICTIFIR